MRLRHLSVAVFLLLWGCDTGSPGGAPGTDGSPPPSDGGPGAEAGSSWNDPDPQGRKTEGNQLEAEPVMLIVTSKALAGAWQAYADHRARTGLHVRVLTVEEIVAARPAPDPAAAVREELRARAAKGLRYALLGGDAEHVPFRRVKAKVTLKLLGFPVGSYDTGGPSQVYFADLDTDWDPNSNKQYGEPAEVPVDRLRAPEIAVGRVPASTTGEVQAYLAKVQRYESDPGGRATRALLLSDIALRNVPVLGDIDAAEGVETTFKAFFPPKFKAQPRRLYATQAAAAAYGGQVLTPPAVAQALQQGHLLTFHNGHGSHGMLTEALGLGFVAALKNTLPTVLVSCACLTGNFADHGAAPQPPGDDSAGERFITGPHGGVAYVGNTGTGVGAFGGSQFLHAMFRGMFKEGKRRIGDAFNAGHAGVSSVTLQYKGITMPMDKGSERWTHLVVILLGDPALAVWTDEPRTIHLDAPESYGPGYRELIVTVSGPGPLSGIEVTALKRDDFLLRAATDDKGKAVFRFVPRGPAPIRIHAGGANVIPATAVIKPEG